MFIKPHFVHPQVKKNYEALRQRQEEECSAQSSPARGREDTQSKWEKESQEATRELLKVKDRLIEVERNVSTSSSLSECLYVSKTVDIADVCPECHSPSREAGSPDTVKAAGVSERESPGTDTSSSETDRVPTGEQHHTTNTERQTTGQSRSPRPVIQSSAALALRERV